MLDIVVTECVEKDIIDWINDFKFVIKLGCYRMTYRITKEQYIKDPCGTCSTAFWKNVEYDKPHNIEIIHEKEFVAIVHSGTIVKYFRLFHTLNDVASLSNDDFFIQTVDVEKQKGIVAAILNECYNTKYSFKFVENLTKQRVFDNDLWIFIIERSTMLPVALGIADYDSEIREGSLEWVQVLPEKRRLGLGELIVNELLRRLKNKADFVTVSGEIDNSNKPDLLYRKCGFTGDDVWYVVYGE